MHTTERMIPTPAGTMVLGDTCAVLAHVDRDAQALAIQVGAIGFCMGGPHVCLELGPAT